MAILSVLPRLKISPRPDDPHTGAKKIAVFPFFFRV